MGAREGASREGSKVLEEHEEEEEEEEKQEAIGEVFSRRVAGDVAAVAAQCVSNSHRPSPPSLTLLSSSSSSPDEWEYLSYLGAPRWTEWCNVPLTTWQTNCSVTCVTQKARY